MKPFTRRTNSDLPNEHGQSYSAPYGNSNAVPVTRAVQLSNPTMYAIPPPMTSRSFTVITNTTPETSRVVGFDIKRRGMMVQNLGGSSVFLSVGSQAGFDGITFTGAMEVPAGASYEFPANCAPVNDVYVVGLANDAIFIMESVLAI